MPQDTLPKPWDCPVCCGEKIAAVATGDPRPERAFKVHCLDCEEQLDGVQHLSFSATLFVALVEWNNYVDSVNKSDDDGDGAFYRLAGWATER